ncbi:hypothetical protein ACOSP7_004934 [Xanthoceras sorbifolium]
MQLRSQMHHTTKGNISISEYILKIRNLANCLVVASQPISDRDLLMNILQGLGSEFDMVVVNITSMQSSIFVREAQIFFLMSYESRLNQQVSSASLTISNASANYSQSNFQRTTYERKKRTVYQLCGKSGHYSAICFHRFDQSFQGNRPPYGQQQQGSSAQNLYSHFQGNNSRDFNSAHSGNYQVH